MRNKYMLLPMAVCLLLVSCSVSCTPLPEDGQSNVIGDQFLIGEAFQLSQGDEVDGNIVGIGTNLILESGSLVNGDIILIGSTLDSSGIIQGDLNVFAGSSHLMNNALVKGDINQFFHKVILDEDVKVTGEINAFTFPDFPVDRLASTAASLSELLRLKRVIWIQLSFILIMALLSLLVAILFPKPTAQIAGHIMAQPLAAWGVGLFISVGVPIVAFFLIISLCLLPIGILLILTALFSYLYGWLVLGLVFGKILQRWFHMTWTLEILSFTGSLGLGLIVSTLNWLPCIGWLSNLLLGCLGLGAVTLSRFGTLPAGGDTRVKPNTVLNDPLMVDEQKTKKRINSEK